jgi:hypothetical protein
MIMANKRSIEPVVALLAFHVFADLMILQYGLLLCEQQGPLQLAALALPVAQASWLATWAARSTWRSYLRLPLVPVGLAWLWWVGAAAGDMTYKDLLAVPHAVALAVQAAVIVAVLSVGRVVGHWRRRESADDAPSRWQFSLGSLLAWTTAAAVLLGVGKWTVACCGWKLDDLVNKYTVFAVGTGSFDAIYALLVICLMAPPRRAWLRALLSATAAGVIALLASVQGSVLESITEYDLDVTAADWRMLAVFHVALLLITLLPTRTVVVHKESCLAESCQVVLPS